MMLEMPVRRYWPRRAANPGEKQTSLRGIGVQQSATERSWKSEECFDIGYRDPEFRVFPAGFHSCCGPVFPQYAPSPLFWSSNIYSVPWHGST